jgi:hypothetical protein
MPSTPVRRESYRMAPSPRAAGRVLLLACAFLGVVGADLEGNQEGGEQAPPVGAVVEVQLQISHRDASGKQVRACLHCLVSRACCMQRRGWHGNAP